MALLISPAELSARFSMTSFGGMWNFAFLCPLRVFLEVPAFWHSEEATFCNAFTMLVWAMGLKLQERERETESRLNVHLCELHLAILLPLVWFSPSDCIQCSGSTSLHSDLPDGVNVCCGEDSLREERGGEGLSSVALWDDKDQWVVEGGAHWTVVTEEGGCYICYIIPWPHDQHYWSLQLLMLSIHKVTQMYFQC